MEEQRRTRVPSLVRSCPGYLCQLLSDRLLRRPRWRALDQVVAGGFSSGMEAQVGMVERAGRVGRREGARSTLEYRPRSAGHLSQCLFRRSSLLL